MDTIIYLYRKRNAEEQDIQMMHLDGYLLVKAGIKADAASWFGRRLPEKPDPPGKETEGQPTAEENKLRGKRILPRLWKKTRKMSEHGETKAAGRTGLRDRLMRRRKGRELCTEQPRRLRVYRKQLLEYEIRTEAIEDIVSGYITTLLRGAETAGGRGELHCVYEPSVAFLKNTGQGIGFFWNRFWNVPELCNYTDYQLVRPLTDSVKEKYSDYVMLGTAGCVFELLKDLARHMKRLQWYLLREELTAEIQEKIEDFYQDYGLAIAICLMEEGKAFRTLRLFSETPVCVLDFCHGERLFAGELKKDSLWLDFTSDDGKKRYLARQPGVTYESMLTYWSGMKKRNVRYL